VYDACSVSIDVEDIPGVLNQVTGVVARRGYNVQSLAVGNSEESGVSRITMVVPGKASEIGKLVKQLLKLVYVRSVTELHLIPHVARELMLIKVSCTPAQRGEILDLAKIFHGSICDVSKRTMTMEVVGKEAKMKTIQDVLEPYGILEIARTGRIALARESGVDTKYLSTVSVGRVML
jgi:acetolactate synthase-1/3 small subunit